MADEVLPLATKYAHGSIDPTPDTYVKRNKDGGIAVKQAAVNGLLNSGATILTPAAAEAGQALAASSVQLLNAAVGPYAVRLPPAAASLGHAMIFIKIDQTDNVPSIQGNGEDQIASPAGYANVYAELKKFGDMSLFFAAKSSLGVPQWFAGRLS